MLKIQCNVFNTASLCSNQAKFASRFSNKVLKANSSSKGRQWFVVRADLYKCGNCGNEFTQARIGRGLKCGKCGQKDANKFAVANRCTNCVGEGTCDCYKCGGAGIIEQKSWEIEGIIPKLVVTGEKPCKKCSGKRLLPCTYCRGQGKVFYRSADWR
mmetsp:Transcript_10644/g.14500  ORF Transcript_10644/g.14500 Transcript_10644/m.14500 type:complete len:157 (+) Transcript_10644:67-537(+)